MGRMSVEEARDFYEAGESAWGLGYSKSLSKDLPGKIASARDGQIIARWQQGGCAWWVTPDFVRVDQEMREAFQKEDRVNMPRFIVNRREE